MTTNNTPSANPAVTAFLKLLQSADSVRLENSPLLSSWEVSDVTGDGDNKVATFSWCEGDGMSYRVCLTERGIAEGSWQDNTFWCYDHEGDTVQIHLNKHQTLSPNAKCEAEKFLNELLDNHESLSGIAEVHGRATLADLLYLYSAINTDGFIDVWTKASNTKVHEIALALPSGARWAKFMNIIED